MQFLDSMTQYQVFHDLYEPWCSLTQVRQNRASESKALLARWDYWLKKYKRYLFFQLTLDFLMLYPDRSDWNSIWRKPQSTG